MIKSGICLVFLSLCMYMGSTVGAFGMAQSKCVIKSPNDNIIKAFFDVECPQTLEEKEKGLMFRKDLMVTEGMLFEYNPPEITKFWMKNTEIPLDVLFVNSKGVIISIYKNRRPFDLTGFGPNVEIQAVLEVPAGSVQKYNIKVGDLLNYDKFK